MGLSHQNALVFDFGLFVENAARLARDFGNVWYYVPWESAFPKANKAKIGTEFKGLERIMDYEDYVDKADVLIFFDTHCGSKVEYFRDKGYRVFGAGKATRLELDRRYARKRQGELGLPTQHTEHLVGITELRDHLARVKSKYVKINTMRGDVESFEHRDLDSSEPVLNQIEHEAGPYAEDMEFTVEDKIEGMEPGADLLMVNGTYASPAMWGYERKGAGYIGKKVDHYDQLPAPMKKVMDGLAGEFKDERTFLSSEVIVTPKGTPYLIDLTVRCAAPAVAAIQCELWENYSEVIWEASDGKLIAPKFAAPYFAGVALESSWAEDKWLPVDVDESVDKWIKFRMASMSEGRVWSTPGFSSICTVIGFGKTPQEAVAQVKEHLEGVRALSLDKTSGRLDEIIEEAKKGEKLGIGL